MAELVREHPVLVLSLLDRGDEREHRVLHALDQAFDGGGVGPRILPPRLAEMLDREPGHLVGFFPRRRARPVHGLNQDAAPARRVPAVIGRRGPGEVPHPGGGDVPGLRAGGTLCAARGGLRPRHDLHGLAGAPGSRQPGAHGWGPHRERVSHGPCRGNEEPRRQRERDVEVAVFEVELPGADVGQGIPSVYVVVHDHPRVPLADLVQPVSDAPHAPAAVWRHREMPGDVEVDRSPGRQGAGGRELDPHHRPVFGPPELRSGCAKSLDRDPADEPLAGEVEHGTAREVQRRLVKRIGDAVLGEEVLLDLDPHEGKRVGGMVLVMNALGSTDHRARRVECRADHVIGALLPVVRARRARRAAHAIRCGKGERAKGGGIADLRVQREQGGGDDLQQRLTLESR